jgi:hypothetical protein
MLGPDAKSFPILERMRIGRRYFNAELEDLTNPDDTPYGEKLRRYCERIRDFKKKGVGLFLWGDNSRGKCVVPETIILWNGRLREIGSLYEGSLISVPLGGSVHVAGQRRETSEFFDNGVTNDVFRLELSDGSELKGTAEHPVLVHTGKALVWVRLSDLRPGDNVVVEFEDQLEEGSLESLESGREITAGLGELCGWIMAEGGVDTGITFTNKNEAALSRVRQLFLLEYGVRPYSEAIRKGSTRLYYSTSLVPREDFLELGCGGGSGHKHLGKALLRSPRRVLVAFLRALFGGDGTVGESAVEYTSKSENLIRQLQILLKALGIRSSISSGLKAATNGKRILRTYWRLSIRGWDVAEFHAKIGFPVQELEKQASLDELVSVVLQTSKDFDVFEVGTLIKELREIACKRLGTGKGYGSGTEKRTGGLQGLLGKQLNYRCRAASESGRISRFTLREILDSLGFLSGSWVYETLRELAYARRSTSQVKVVSTLPMTRTVDLVVPEIHCFWSAGFVSHNSHAAAVVLKEARRCGFSGLLISPRHYVAGQIEKEWFDEGVTLAQRAEDVDFLVLDDMGKEYTKKSGSSGWSESNLEYLWRERSKHCRVTLVTTNLTDKGLKERYGKSIFQLVLETLVPMNVKGKNFRVAEHKQLRDLLEE